MATASLVAQISTKGASKAQTELKGVSTQAKKTETNVTKIGTSFKGMSQQAAASAAAINGPMGGIASRISAVATVLTTGTAAATLFGVALTGVGFALASGVKELESINVEMAKTEAILNATGFASGKTTAQLTEQARAIAMATLASTTGIQAAQAKLLTFDKIHGQVFDDAIALTQDLATVFGGDAASQATQLGKALQDPIAGLTALNRVGVSFTEQQKAQVKAMVATGDTMKAQTLIVDALKKQVGGAGESVAKDSLAGKLDTAGQLWSEFAGKLATSTGTMTLTEKLLNGMVGRLGELNALLEPEDTSDLFQKRLDILFEIADLENKINSDPNSASIVDTSKLAALKSEAQELFEQIKQQSAEDNKEILDAAAAHEASQLKIKKDALTLQAEIEKTAREKQVLADLEFYDKREAARVAAEEKTRAATRKAEQDDADFYMTVLKAKESADAAAAEAKQKANEDVITGLGSLTENLKTVLGEQSAAYKAAALLDVGVSTYAAAQKTFEGFQSLPQPYGLIAGSAGAGVAIGVGVKNAQSILSAREQGGDFTAGQDLLVGERGPEIVSFGSSGKVTNNTETNKALNNSGNNVSIVVLDQSSGSKEYIQEEQDDGRIILLIKNTMVAETNTPNTPFDKALTGRGQPRVR